MSKFFTSETAKKSGSYWNRQGAVLEIKQQTCRQAHEQSILDLLKVKNGLTLKQLAEETGFSLTDIKTSIKQLYGDGRVRLNKQERKCYAMD